MTFLAARSATGKGRRSVCWVRLRRPSVSCGRPELPVSMQHRPVTSRRPSLWLGTPSISCTTEPCARASPRLSIGTRRADGPHGRSGPQFRVGKEATHGLDPASGCRGSTRYPVTPSSISSAGHPGSSPRPPRPRPLPLRPPVRTAPPTKAPGPRPATRRPPRGHRSRR